MDRLPCQSWVLILTLLYVGGVRCDCSDTDVGIEGGNYTLTKGLRNGSQLVYHCPKGQYPYPVLSRLCLRRGRWKPRPDSNLPQTCKLVECPSPIVLMNGDVFPLALSYVFGNETRYECYSGFALKGSSKRVCQENGKWSGSTPICIQESGSSHKCPDPGIPPGTIRTGNTNNLNDKVRYSCSGDMILIGSQERMCTENSQWTGREPVCYYKHTYDTALEVSRAFGGAIEESLTTHTTDDIQEGKKIKILKSGTLNIYIAMDVSNSIDEKHKANAKRAVQQLIKKISSFSVTPNYEIIFFTSEIHEAVNILDFFEKTVDWNTMKKAIDEFDIQSLKSGTDITNVFEKFLQRMTLIQLKVGEKNFEEHQHVIVVFTDGGYNMGGSPEPSVRNIKNLVYLADISGTHDEKREEYLDIYIFGIGFEIYDDYLMPLVVGKGGNHYFRLKDMDTLDETFDEIIDENDVKGLCGLHRTYNTQDPDNSRRRFPWFAFVTIQNRVVKNCFGSLVTPSFILTAAHCFSFGDRPEHVTVMIGDGYKSVREVKTFIIHPDFNIAARKAKGVEEFYDYDVALIQLQEDVEISNTLRPICLPCTKETSAALRLDATSTCQQQEELLLGNGIEQLSFLTKNTPRGDDTVDKVLEKVVHAKLRDNRGSCIKHALKAFGMTTRDVTDAVTPNFLCTGGESLNFIDYIACKGDLGGAVFKDYDHRTIQVAVASWGTTDLCDKGGLHKSTSDSRDFHINLFKMMPFLKEHLGNNLQDDYIPLEFLD